MSTRRTLYVEITKPDLTRVRRLSASAGLVALAAGAFALGGWGGATATTNSTEVAIHQLVPAKVVTAGTSVAANKAYTFLARGGASTVPSNAKVVRLQVTAKGTKDGRVAFYPHLEYYPASPDEVSWTAGATGSGTVDVKVGSADKVTMSNYSSASVTVSIRIVGYADQFSASNISDFGGGPNDVLRNGGPDGAYWGSLLPKLTTREVVLTDSGPSTRLSGSALCASGEYPFTGGVRILGDYQDASAELVTSAPTTTGWDVALEFTSADQPKKATIYVTCAAR